MTWRRSPAWSQVKLRVVAESFMPEVGDELRFRNGRRYQVLEIRGRGLRCLVLPPEAEVQGTVHEWHWSPRQRRYPHARIA